MMKRLFKAGIAAALIALLVYLVDLQKLWAALSELTVGAVIALALLSVALIYVSAFKWKLFLDELGAPVSIARLFQLYIVAYFVNCLFPSYIGGDALRSWYVGKKIGQHQAFAATVLERFMGLVAMVVLALGFMWFVELVTVQIKIIIVLIALGLTVVTVLALSEKPLKLLERFPQLSAVIKNVRKIQSALHSARGNRELLLKTFALSLLYHSFTVVNTLVAAHAVGWDNPPLGDLFVVLPIILLVGSIPATPQGLGIQEGAFYFFLHGIGATPAQALGVAVVLRAKSYVLALIGGLVWLRIRNDHGGAIPPTDREGPTVLS